MLYEPWGENIQFNDQTVEIHNVLHKKSKKQQIQQILSDLQGSSKSISSIYFYDANGSALFEKITTLPEYYLTRTEIPLIEEAALVLCSDLHDAEIIEFGSGDCTKISLLLEAIPTQSHHTITYIPFDVSDDAIKQSSQILLETFPHIAVKGIVADFMTQLTVINTSKPAMFCFLGSTIGNLSMKQAAHFLTQISTIMKTEDNLLIGFDMVKDKKILEQAYNDRQQVTEIFNKNILHVINKRVGTDFNPSDFDHVAFFNESQSRIEMHLQAKKPITITCPDPYEQILIKENERIRTEYSYKFTDEHIEILAENAGLYIQEVFTDDKHWFSLVQFKKT